MIDQASVLDVGAALFIICRYNMVSMLTKLAALHHEFLETRAGRKLFESMRRLKRALTRLLIRHRCRWLNIFARMSVLVCLVHGGNILLPHEK
ncbi:hypothetical protein QBC41DRAFT_32268 [Cercophora samala]|uniref:Transposase DDE domain-containing protein n=1 Tax=Cercophora samala TaxID=330535 RepID=A0AA39Z0S8_9PEZI|nr:hypothetical protein QBC41DRAFT_32268 [Cercophora samala]